MNMIEGEQKPEQQEAPKVPEDEALAAGGEEAQPGSTGGGQRRSRRRNRHGGDDRDDYHGDERANMALEFVTSVIDGMDMDCRVRLRRPRQENPDEEPEIVVEVTGRDSGRIIGKKGQVLAALQFLTHRVINRPGQDRRHVLVDADGYRLRREASLATMAKRLGKQAVDDGKIITFEPMNPRDRRVVHLALAKFERASRANHPGTTRVTKTFPHCCDSGRSLTEDRDRRRPEPYPGRPRVTLGPTDKPTKSRQSTGAGVEALRFGLGLCRFQSYLSSASPEHSGDRKDARHEAGT
jgi:spoIIIJ-associated protein